MRCDTPLLTAGIQELAADAVRLHQAAQKPWELGQLGSLIADHACRNALEIGTYRGGTAWFFQELGVDVTVIDPSPLGRRDGISYVIGRSVEVQLQAPAGIDLLFIDGDHSYDGAKSDWELYRPLVNRGGLVAFHDIVEHHPAEGCHVAPLWAEVRREHRTVEIADPGETLDLSHPWGGIGVVFL